MSWQVRRSNNHIEDAVVDLLYHGCDEHECREGIKDTPKRVQRFYEDFITKGDPTFNLTTFAAEGMDEMIVQREIPFYSLCEHHMLPFFGTAVVAYLPTANRIIGLSKLARVVDWYARRLQNQERLTQQVAVRLATALGEKDRPACVAVAVRARHMCMEMRGIKARGAETITSYLLGRFRSDASCRAEFLELIK